MISTTNTMKTAGLQGIITKDTTSATDTKANTTTADTTFADWLKAIDDQVIGTNYVDKINIFTGEVMHNYPVPIFKPTPAETTADAMTPQEQASALVDNYLKYQQTEKGQRGAVNPAGGDGYNTSDWAQSFILEPRVGYNTANILLEAVRSGKITDHVPADKIDSLLASLTGATSSTTSTAASSTSTTTTVAANTATTATDESSQTTLASASNTADAASQTQQDLTQILKDLLDGIAKLEAIIQSSIMLAKNTTNTNNTTNTTSGSNNSNAFTNTTQLAQMQTSKTVDLNQILGYNILNKLFNTNNGGRQGYLA
ncbi:MAG: hypothetical protein ACUVQ2_03600 [Dissulfurimicrobium sp.]|uniref:hypothetical protein n=1 Tax=Dissulfurimicrobium sp. TaxID=2022436 RepID=UPI00404ACCAB